jgi:heme/copper-type cytochrome/quinol oxidase subunit 2
MRTRRNNSATLIACFLVAGLAIYVGLMRGPVGEALAHVVGGDMAGNQVILHNADVPAVPADEGRLLRVISITASNFRFNPQEIRLTKGQTVTLRFISIDRTYSFQVRALDLDTSIYPGTEMEITVTPRVAGTFEAIGVHYGGAGPTYMKIVVIQ